MNQNSLKKKSRKRYIKILSVVALGTGNMAISFLYLFFPFSKSSLLRLNKSLTYFFWIKTYVEEASALFQMAQRSWIKMQLNEAFFHLKTEPIVVRIFQIYNILIEEIMSLLFLEMLTKFGNTKIFLFYVVKIIIQRLHNVRNRSQEETTQGPGDWLVYHFKLSPFRRLKGPYCISTFNKIFVQCIHKCLHWEQEEEAMDNI